MASYRERTYVCKRGHYVKSWQWNGVESVPCSVAGCRLKALIALPRRFQAAQNSEPFAYYKNPLTGELFIPAAHQDTRHPKGYQRHEIRTMRQYERFVREQSALHRAGIEESRRDEDQTRALLKRESREQLQQMMKDHFTPEGRGFAEAVMEYMDSQPDRQEYDHRIYISGFEFDRSNRVEHNDAESNYRRRD